MRLSSQMQRCKPSDAPCFSSFLPRCAHFMILTMHSNSSLLYQTIPRPGLHAIRSPDRPGLDITTPQGSMKHMFLHTDSASASSIAQHCFSANDIERHCCCARKIARHCYSSANGIAQHSSSASGIVRTYIAALAVYILSKQHLPVDRGLSFLLGPATAVSASI